MLKVGDRVILTRHKSVAHFTGAHMRDKPMAITGTIMEIDNSHYEGNHNREYGITFDDRVGVWWYAYREIKKIGQ